MFARYAEIMPYYTYTRVTPFHPTFARYAEIMPYYTITLDQAEPKLFARYAEIMPYYTDVTKNQPRYSLLGMLK